MDNETLFRYFSAKTTEEEERRINDWLLDDVENEKKLRSTYDLWEAMLFKGSGYDPAAKVPSKRRRNIRRWSLAVLNAAAIAMVFFVAKHLVTVSEDNALASTINTIEVPDGGKMDIILSDGTKVCLNAGARLDYPLRFARDSRQVSVSGEAWFEVAHDADKPFTVKTFLSDVEVLGTKFNLDADESAGHFSITLAEGSIRLRGDAGEKLMVPGEKVDIVGGKMTTCSYSPEKAKLWMNGIIDISGLTFLEIMRKLEKSFEIGRAHV